MNTRYKLTIAYDGTNYAGWQVQPGKTTVQGEVENAIEKMTGRHIRIHHSGRTDSGVHAKGQVAHFDLKEPVDTGRFMNGLNAHLDYDIRVMKMEKVRSDFNARYDAVSKEYRYFVWNGDSVPPELRLYRLHERRKLDIKAMRIAAEQMIGKHDFSAFTANPHREIEGTVKTITKMTVSRTREGDLTICVVGEGFLYKMVRTITGFLLRVGIGELQPEDARRFLKAGARTGEIPTVKP
ncbi:MAG: tRNA pseudouridine(38-40) synthase TruA, partial [Verrucomicrobia bacterium]|nr:tRNA pseudouridine(38-40) synthase TruA [Verrucomicrobiota bacterium]